MMIKGLLIWKERFRMLMFVKKIIFKGGSEMKFLCGYFPMIVFAMLSFVSFSAIGQDVVTPTVPELGPSVMELWKAIADKAPLAVVLVAVMQMLRTDLFGNLLGKINTGLLPLVTIVIGLVIAVIEGLATGKGLVEILISTLIVSGQGMVLYDTVIKHFFKKKTVY